MASSEVKVRGSSSEVSQATIDVSLTDNIRQWIRRVLLTADLPREMREELRKYTTSRRTEEDKKHRTIPFQLVQSVHALQQEKGVHLHELLEGSDICLPEVEVTTRSPELEARIEKLKAEQSQREYDQMTNNVRVKTQAKNTIADESVGKQLRAMNNQLLSVFNFVVTVAGSFAFAYKATEYSMERPNFPVQIISGLCVATIVFIADLYFLIKYSQ